MAGYVTLGAITNFFDTFGIGSFATTTVALKSFRLTDDRNIPGTLIVGHALPVFAQAAVFIAAVKVDRVTLTLMIVAAVVGAWLGAMLLPKTSVRVIRLCIGLALLVASAMMVLTNLGWLPLGGDATGLTGVRLAAAVGGNVLLGMLMVFGVGLYGPCMILVSLLGMNTAAAFPIMMGSCAVLMPVSAARIIRSSAFDRSVAIGLAAGGVPAVLVAALVVRSLPTMILRWIVVVVGYLGCRFLKTARRQST
ncbi:sulfite exporter TauE/SafE family protein [Sphingomonas sp. CGMCC 1.13654]|uniref:Probable membrane transporter protein n=1 Tax=Sphingomonas chungangi TaxID=2683589 RepID=A0A838L227_9SPHN|nr:sulfite exporter TauE/SafE family protein [Sphingomonas chungangi]MBA2933553.1 sulfite exporter TauE/SafE family protein [Sphingomonas chungangi]